ncbi:MAG: NUDIX hydrolase [Tissierellia bacterium]|nr:NUDIX hydrolase [Tissierellia bacterium]
MAGEERTIGSERIYDGKIVSLRCDTVELNNQRYAKREIVEHEGGVAVLALDPQGKIFFVKQFRVAVGKEMLELPAGLVEHDEMPMDAAARELEEETGQRPGKVNFLLECYTSPGFSTEKIHLFLAEDLTSTEQNLDDDEEVEVYRYSLEEALKLIQLGEIVDAKTIVGILTLAQEGRRHDK